MGRAAIGHIAAHRMKPGTSGAHSLRSHIPTLDGWRTIAISLVVIHHLGTTYFSEADYWSHSPTRFGTMGVPIFFGLSGLLICKLLLEEFDSSGRISRVGFYIRRCFRILPPLFVFLGTIWTFGLITNRFELLSSVFFGRNYLTGALAGPYTDHLWSLSVEEHFYLLWPTVLCWLLITRRALAGTLALAIGFGLWRSVDLHTHLTAHLLPLLDAQARTDYRLDGLMWGCLAAFLLHRPQSRRFLEAHLGVVPFVIALFLFIALLLVSVPMAPMWLAMLIPLLMLATVTHPRWLFSRVLETAPIRWIGRISYSLYLWQQAFLIPSWQPIHFRIVQHWPWNLLAPVVCAGVSYYLVEKPLIRIGRGLAAKFTDMGARPRRTVECAPVSISQ